MLDWTIIPRNLPPLRSSRRGFLIGAASVAGGLAIGFHPIAATAQAAAETLNPLETLVLIGADDRVTIMSSQFDMGQGAYHGLATLVLEELGARWDQVEVAGGWGNPNLFGNPAMGGFQGTGGSTSMSVAWDRYRLAGATAREMLVAAAAEHWGVPAGEISVADGQITHPTAGNLPFGAVAAAAAALPVPAEPALKSPADWTIIGDEALRRFDSAPKTNGTHDFTLDIQLPGMLTAVMIHPPRFGATVASFDAGDALAMPGVVDVVATSRGVAVVGEHMWAALRARDAVTVDWDETAAETRGTDAIMAEYHRLAGTAPMAMAMSEGDTATALEGAAQVLEAEFEFPFLAHAALEPLNAVAARAEDGTVEVWGGMQMPDLYQMVLTEIAGVTPDKLRLHVMKTGGGFGRRAVFDADVLAEAVAVARALDWRAPVKVQWTRENDMRGGRYRPAYVHKVRAGLDAEGRLAGWDHHIVGQSIIAGGPFAMMIEDGIDVTSVEGALHLPYDIPNRSVGLTTTDVRVPVLWWRSVGSTHNAYVVETFLDELAAAAGKDPLDFRMEMMAASPRHAAVLSLAAEKAGWDTPPPEGRFRGIALAESFETYVAQVAEISLGERGVRVHKVVCAVDCGIAINPDNIRAQMEGSIGFGLGAILDEEVTMTEGVVDQGNYDGYPPLRIDAMPEVEVHIVPSTERPTGVGEPGVPPIGPAVANAIRAATGRPVRVLPINKALQV